MLQKCTYFCNRDINETKQITQNTNTNLNHLTRLPSNLRLTTHECEHLVMHSHFQSHNKDGDHTIPSAIAENPTLHASFMAL